MNLKKFVLKIVLVIISMLYYPLPIGKILTFHNIIILIKSVLNKDQYRYYYNSFLEKYLYQLAEK